MTRAVTLTPAEAARILADLSDRPSVVMNQREYLALRMGAEMCAREARREATVRVPR